MPDLNLVLRHKPTDYNFFQLLRLLELAANAGGTDASSPVGYDEPIAKEFVEFTVAPTLSFPASSIDKAETIGEKRDERTKLQATCFGLTGTTGVLPAFYTEMLGQRVRHKDTAFRDLLDGFNARSIAFLYRAWQKSSIPISFERRLSLKPTDERDHASEAISAYTGIGGPVQPQTKAKDLESVALYFSGYYSKRPRNADALEQIVTAVLGVKVKVMQFFGRWFELDSDQRNSLGEANATLGADLVIGNAVFEGNNSFRIRTEPVNYADFQRLLPDQPLFNYLKNVVLLYVGSEYVVDLQVVLKKEEVPQFQLMSAQDGSDGAGLGIGLWAISSTPAQDVDEAVFTLNG
ncbi:MAG: type VI secretion system baseplate subunit TssG [Chromatiales bacterium]|nr:type VI secretion system baseplate subunit TssG [Chromatiales bacterium]